MFYLYVNGIYSKDTLRIKKYIAEMYTKLKKNIQ